ncbi:hypothetical protein [Acaryochloris marina]|uniref:Uncharacterized protein n=1 Tax=Acaryochloris marina (strain MBIC 11017) TaxID=329726 RepID=A8ZPM0_ACAM1|nr:hypothetical protein [Acaryochloris marina]ABW32956.1 hypothetical protein AM1_E0187 [Acaryochloris marina MBIC11017]
MPKPNRTNIIIRCQPISGSKQELIIKSARSFYGSKFKKTVELALVDLFEPIHIAIEGGSAADIQNAIESSAHEIRDLHREALNQCQKNGYVSASQVVQATTSADMSPQNCEPDEDEPELEFD